LAPLKKLIVYLILPRKEGRATGCCCGLGGENNKGRDNLEVEKLKKLAFGDCLLSGGTGRREATRISTVTVYT
jgi:hypothetical protein